LFSKVDLKDLSKEIDYNNITVNNEDFNMALEEVKPAFGRNETMLLKIDNCLI